jgi:hypothetical protein
MATQSAANCNPIISAYVKRLRERGKPYKCAIVAAMRKLLLHPIPHQKSKTFHFLKTTVAS